MDLDLEHVLSEQHGLLCVSRPIKTMLRTVLPQLKAEELASLKQIGLSPVSIFVEPLAHETSHSFADLCRSLATLGTLPELVQALGQQVEVGENPVLTWLRLCDAVK